MSSFKQFTSYAALIFFAIMCLRPSVATAAKPVTTALILGAGPISGARAGLGMSGGLARVSCGELGCSGYGLLLTNRMGSHNVTSLEAGFGGFVIFFPVYAGAGVRRTNGRISGGQLSVGLGFGPVTSIATLYTEDSTPHGELGLSISFPIPIGAEKF